MEKSTEGTVIVSSGQTLIVNPNSISDVARLELEKRGITVKLDHNAPRNVAYVARPGEYIGNLWDERKTSNIKWWIALALATGLFIIVSIIVIVSVVV